MCSHLSFNCLLHRPTSSICHLVGKTLWGSSDILVFFSPLFWSKPSIFSFMTLPILISPPPSNGPWLLMDLACLIGSWPTGTSTTLLVAKVSLADLKGVPFLPYPLNGPLLETKSKTSVKKTDLPSLREMVLEEHCCYERRVEGFLNSYLFGQELHSETEMNLGLSFPDPGCPSHHLALWQNSDGKYHWF